MHVIDLIVNDSHACLNASCATCFYLVTCTLLHPKI